jgi:hypothetical protein
MSATERAYEFEQHITGSSGEEGIKNHPNKAILESIRRSTAIFFKNVFYTNSNQKE